ncbi:MAG: hypothetical protein ACUVUC_04575 [Thermoguttaceae bacterium]
MSRTGRLIERLRSSRRLRPLVLTIAIGFFAVIPAGLAAWACETPVFRYAMYRWLPEPYHVFYFYRGEPDKADAQVNRRLSELATADPPANLLLATVDATKQEQVDQLPGPVKQAWQQDAGGKAPCHLVFTSWGDLVWNQRLDDAAVSALVDSPLRKRIAGLLHEGHAGVFLLFGGDQEAANAEAEKAAQEAIARAAKGLLGEFAQEELGADPGAVGGQPGDPTTPAPISQPAAELFGGPQRLKVALVKLQRSDPAETLLVRSVATVERAIPEAAGKPMVFTIFGRGRVLPPCIGPDITTDNLCEQLGFLAGACSCVLKAQNPGVDLLFAWDWEATAEKLALAEQEEPEPLLQPEPPDQQPAQLASQPPSPDQPSQSPALAAIVPETATPAPLDEPGSEGSGESLATRQAWQFSLGLALALAGVVAVGFVVIRRRRDQAA